MGSNFIDDLNKISDRQGKPRIDPTRIEGFGDGAPPVPPLRVEIPSAASAYGDPLELPEDDEQAPAPPPSPLLMLGAFAQPLAPKHPETEAELWVRDGSAGYCGHSASLSDADRKVIAKVVLRAMRRSVDALYSEKIGVKPRTARKAKKPASRVRPLAGS